MQENRLFKYKFIYFYSIIFLFGWFLYYGFIIGNIFFKGFRLNENFGFFSPLLYLLVFSNFIFLILSLINIFKESYRAIFYFNIFILLLIITTFVNGYSKQVFEKPFAIPAFILYVLFFGYFDILNKFL